MKFLSIAVTVVILFCGVGSMVILAVTALTVAPASHAADEARAASARLFSELARDWSEESLSRTCENPDDPSLIKAAARLKAELGPLYGAPRIRLVKAPFHEGQDTACTILVRGMFAHGERNVPVSLARRGGSPWLITELGAPETPPDLQPSARSQAGARGTSE